MLTDHRLIQERWAARQRARLAMPAAFGEFIAGLAEWSWFFNPISFRDDWRKAHRRADQLSQRSGPPCSDEGLHYVGEYFRDIGKAAGGPIGWVLGEEFGTLGLRYHCHGLLSGVSHLSCDFWWAEAFRRFGRTLIEPFDPQRAAAFYAAQYAAKEHGAIRLHFGGVFQGQELKRADHSFELRQAGPVSAMEQHKEIVLSADLGRDFYKTSTGRWHR